MARTKVIPIHTLDDLKDIQHYLANREHHNHAEHELVGPLLYKVREEAEFRRKVETTIALLNRERGRDHQIKILAYWVIIRFEDQAGLTEVERQLLLTAANNRLADGAPTWGFWHLNYVLEADDFNLLVPAFRCSGFLPIFRSQQEVSFYSECRAIADDFVFAVNKTRLAGNIPPIVSPESFYSSASPTLTWETAERKVAKAASKINAALNIQTLPNLLEASGLKQNEDWEWEGGVFLRFRRSKKKHGSAWFRIRCEDFLENAAAEMSRLIVPPKATEKKRLKPTKVLADIPAESPGGATHLSQLIQRITPTENHEK